MANTSGLITIVFPSTKFSLNPVTCISTTNPSTNYTCSLKNSSAIELNYVSSGNNLLLVTIATIKNPSSVATYNFRY